MKIKKQIEDQSLFKSLLVAYMILILHVLLLGGIGIIIIFFHGVVNYMLWIFLAVAACIVGAIYFFIKRMKDRSLMDMLNNPVMKGRNVEIKLLGGLATLKMKNNEDTTIDSYNPFKAINQIEYTAPNKIKELSELALLYEKQLITREEFDRIKTQLITQETSHQPLIISQHYTDHE
ncbi:MAG: hypothetical protein HQK77_00090 [Desulfobacterales bacterium]|nr:hypothetical protein [Desulfobacterales bacterium]